MKYLNFIYTIFKTKIQQDMEHRFGFFMLMSSAVFRVLIFVIFFWAIFNNIDNISGWKFEDILILTATYDLADGVLSVFVIPSLMYEIPDKIYMGDFDLILTKPINKLFYSSFCHVSIRNSVKFFTSAVIFYYVFTNYSYDISILQIGLYASTLMCGILLFFSLTTIFSGLIFLIIQSWGMGDILYNFLSFTKYPTTIYKGFLGKIVTYIIPIATVSTLPTLTLTGNFNFLYVAYVIIITLGFVFLSIKFWYWALDRYQSASS